MPDSNNITEVQTLKQPIKKTLAVVASLSGTPGDLKQVSIYHVLEGIKGRLMKTLRMCVVK